MDANNLINMANKIGTFFESMPDQQQALEDIAGHIKRFWAPPMRKAIIASIDNKQDAEMLAIVREALVTHRAKIL